MVKKRIVNNAESTESTHCDRLDVWSNNYCTMKRKNNAFAWKEEPCLLNNCVNSRKSDD